MRRLFYALMILLLAAFAASAQLVTVTGTRLANSNGTPVTGTIYFLPTASNGTPIGYRLPGVGQITAQQVSAPVTAGAFSMQIVDTSKTQPQNICYRVWAADNKGNIIFGSNTGKTSGYNCVQVSPTWCANNLCTFDNYSPNYAPLALVQAGPPGPAVGTTAITPSLATLAIGPTAEYYFHVQVPYTLLTQASTVQDVAIANVPAGFKIRGLTVIESTPFSSVTGITSMTVSIGRGLTSPGDYMLAQPLMQAAGNMRDDGGHYSPVFAAHTIYAEFANTTTSNPASLGNGTTTKLTAGVLDIYLWYMVAL